MGELMPTYFLGIAFDSKEHAQSINIALNLQVETQSKNILNDHLQAYSLIVQMDFFFSESTEQSLFLSTFFKFKAEMPKFSLVPN